MSYSGKMSNRGDGGYTPKGYKSKQTSNKVTPCSSNAKIHVEFIPSPKKQYKSDLTLKNLEDEEFPHGFTLLESLSVTSKENDKKGPETQSSDERTTSESSTCSSQLPLITQYDEIIRMYTEYFENDLTEEFLMFAVHQEQCRQEWSRSVHECRRLQAELDKANHEIGDFVTKLKNARRLLDQEKRLRRKAEEERKNLEQQMLTAREFLFNETNLGLPDDTREKLSFLNNSNSKSHSFLERNIISTGTRLNTIKEVNSAEINSTASLLSDFSYSRSDGELDSSTVFKMKSEEWKKPNVVKKDSKSPKRYNTSTSTHKIVEINPTDKIIATTTLAMSKDGPITATSIIEAVPQSSPETSLAETETPPQEVQPISPRKDKLSSPVITTKRAHSFISKTILCPDTCAACKSRIRFGKMVAKCKECRGICHVDCKNILPLPCVPQLNTPTQKTLIGTLSDYTPSIPPMVPSIIVHCVNEIELRGLREIGLYRIPGVEKDIKHLKEKFLRGKITPNLNNVDVHVLCGVVKDFLRSLREPLVTSSLRKEFIQASEAEDEMDAVSCLYQAISQLPQPNRDTMAYMMLHLNRVAASRECKMPPSNISKIFGPTMIGYSSQDIEPQSLLLETKQQFLVMDHLMKIPIDFWSTYINIDSAATTPRSKQFLGSTESLSKVTRRRFFTADEPSSGSSARKRKKYFGTPPSYKK